MSPWFIFFFGMIIGYFMAMFTFALCKAAGEADDNANRNKCGLPAEDKYGRACKYLLDN